MGEADPDRTVAAYPSVVVEKVRYSDTDRQGHVNNVLFAFFFEAGRVSVLHGEPDLCAPGTLFVLARSTIDFLGELNWPGEVAVGTRTQRIGTSSTSFRQALFQGGRCAALSESVMVQVDNASRTAAPLSGEARAILEGLRPGGG